MVNVDLKCPNCRNERGFNLWCVGEYRVKPFVFPADLTVSEHAEAKKGYKDNPPITAFGVAVCSGCKEAVLVKFDAGLRTLEEIKQTSGTPIQYVRRPIEVLDYHPKPPEPVTHPAYPEKIREEFADIQNMLDQGMSPPLIVGACRRTLEMALFELGAKQKRIHPKIEELRDSGTLTNVLADWAHHIRHIGNGGAHIDDATREEAEELVDFTKVFLEYGFVLPDRIAGARRAREESPD